MGHCVIFCAGGFTELAQPLEEGDFVIAADGGLRHTQALGITPDVVLGDFDSLGYVPEDAQVFPVEKDDTDSMLAVKKGLAMGYRRFVLYGALDGPRLDHTIANLQTLCYLARQGAEGYLVGKAYIVTAVRARTLAFPTDASGILSLFCFGEDACVTVKGTQYELEQGMLTADFPLGVSNHFTEKQAVLTVHKGTVVVMWDRGNGIMQNA